ncbi:MAG: serine protease [Saprospiraceae bacterium]
MTVTAANYHVISNASEIEIEFIRNGQKQIHRTKVIQSDKLNDLAILKIDDDSFHPFINIPYNFKTNLSDVGSNVFALGYPMALSLMGSEIKFTDGKISSKTGFQNDISTYQMTTPIQPGNSGGPLFDFDGNLIGVNSAKIPADVADNVSYAIKTSYLKNLIDVLPSNLKLPNDKTIMNKTLTEKIKILSDYVVLIKIK